MQSFTTAFPAVQSVFGGRMRTHDVFGERRSLPARFRHRQPSQEREQAFPAAVAHRIRIAAIFGIFVDVHIEDTADTVNRMVQ